MNPPGLGNSQVSAFSGNAHHVESPTATLIARYVSTNGRVDTQGLAREIQTLAQTNLQSARHLYEDARKILEQQSTPMDIAHLRADMEAQLLSRSTVSAADFFAAETAAQSTSSPASNTAQPDDGFGVDDGLSLALDLIPVVGTVKGAVELAIGKDPITGEEIPRWQSAIGLIAGMIPGGKAGIRAGMEATEQVAKHGDGVLKAGVSIGEEISGHAAKLGDNVVKAGGKQLGEGADAAKALLASGGKVENGNATPKSVVHGASATRSQNESLWKWNQSAKSPKDAVQIADALGAFKDAIDDIRPSKLNPDIIEVVSHDGLISRFLFLEDSLLDSIVSKAGVFDDVWAYYQPGKRFVTSADTTLIENGAVPVSPNKLMELGDIFPGNAITINIKKSLLKSDQGVASILAHEFHEVHGLYKQAIGNRLLYRNLQSTIDTLHNQAVKIGDDIATKAR